MMLGLLVPLLMFYSYHTTNNFPDLDLQKKNVYEACLEYDIKHPEIVTAQSLLETGNYNCENCSLDSNNVFGWYMCYERDPETKKCIRAGYIYFPHWIFSVAYYKKWQDKRYKGGDYYKFLKKVGYATAPDYKEKVQALVKQHFPEKL